MIYHVTVGKRSFEVELSGTGVRVDGEPASVDMAAVDGTSVRNLLVDGRSYRFVAGRTAPGQWSLHVRGSRYACRVQDERTRAIQEMTGAGTGPSGPRPVVAPMPGLVVKIEVDLGDVVEAGQGVAIVEAMKMENELRAQGPGRVKAIHVSSGDTVEKDQVLVDFEPTGEDDG